jgi:AcrR family transcriptional regulator
MDEISTPGVERPYHHGDLKTALLHEAERILERDGIQALTLRAAARAAGVSHAAPANHFGDLTGLLSELAAAGYNRFSAALNAAGDAAGTDPRGRSQATGRAYVTFARAHPGLFVLMFRGERLDHARPALKEALDSARRALRAADASTGPASSASPTRTTARGVARWSLVHGFAMLLLDGRLDGVVSALPDGENADDLLDSVLSMTRLAD